MLTLNEKGINNAVTLLGGTAAWEKAGLPMETGDGGSSNVNKDGGNKDTGNKTETKPTL